MSEKRRPDRKREYDRDDPTHAGKVLDKDTRLWGDPEEEEETYGDARDYSFKAGTTSRPGSMSRENKDKARGWKGQDTNE